MKNTIKIITISIFISLSVFAYIGDGPNSAVVSIYRKDMGPVFIIKDRSMLKRPLNYEVKKLDNQNYAIIYKGNKPKVLYLNGRPIYITPGDRVHLEYQYISEVGRERDSIIATGDHAENYTYSYLTLFNTNERKERTGRFIPELSNIKYQDAKHSFFDDSRLYYIEDRKYIDSLLSSRGYNNHIIRQAGLDAYAMEMFGNRGDEKVLLKSNRLQLKDFSGKLEEYLVSKNIAPIDTTYSYSIEETIALYFGHLKEIKFAGVKTDQQLQDMISYIKTFPNNFVREYLLYFLMRDYGSRINAKYLIQVKSALNEIKNPIIGEALRNKKFEPGGGFQEGLKLLFE